MLNILTNLLATALLTCSTGAKAVANHKQNEEHNKIVLRNEPKKAYYDPSGENYGTTENTAYNYSSYGIRLQPQTGPELPPIIPSGSSYSPYTSSSQMSSGEYEGKYSYPASAVVPNEDYETQNSIYYDVYVNGVFFITLETPYYGRGNYIFLDTGSGNYVWFFDHQEPMTPQEFNEDIFTAVGDTITGLSDALARPWEGILNIFYDTTENEVTQMDYLVLIGLGISITFLIFWTILKLFRQRN